jgi:lipid II:glycine glycyltransferase (peptidoglycan interpeptide bridge formation enzyme)
MAMKQKTRYNIRLAERKGVEVVEGHERDWDTFLRLYRETAQRDGFFIQSRDFYTRLFTVFREAGTFCMLLARHGADVLAAITLLRFGSICWYLHGASSSRHRNLMAPYLLQWEGIRWAAGQGCSLYDFRAVPDRLREDQDMYGLYRFKEGFGGCQFTALRSHAAPYRALPFQLWQLYSAWSFAARSWLRRRQGLPIRQSA